MNVKNTKSAGGVVINKNGDILIVNQHGDSWSLPKGHVEMGEDILEAAEREIYEESGIKHLSLLKELGHYQRYRFGLEGPDDTVSETISCKFHENLFSNFELSFEIT